jgi:hypothetical protein
VFDDPLLGRRACEAFVKRVETPPYAGEHGEVMARAIPPQPYGYDMVHAFLSEEEREQVRARMATFEGMYTFRAGMMGDLSGCDVIVATAAMLLLDEPGPLLWREPRAGMHRERPAPLEPSGVPGNAVVDPLPENGMPEHWLAAGPFPLPGEGTAAGDPGARVAGTAPLPGSTLVQAGTTNRWHAVPTHWRRPLSGAGARTHYILMGGAPAKSCSYLHAYVNVASPALTRLTDRVPFMRLENRMWINGRPITGNTALVLDPGVYRVLVEVRGNRASPCWEPLDQAGAVGEARRYELEHAAWSAAYAEHQRTGRWGFMSRPVEMSRAKSFARMAAAAEGEPVRLDGSLAVAYWNARHVPMVRPGRFDLPGAINAGTGADQVHRAVFALPVLSEAERGPVLDMLRRRIEADTAPGNISSRDLIALLTFWPGDRLGTE